MQMDDQIMNKNLPEVFMSPYHHMTCR